MEEVVVTAYGLVSSLGATKEEFTERMFAGESGVVSIRDSMVPSSFPVPYAAMVPKHLLWQSEFFKNRDNEFLLKSWLMTALATERALVNVPKDLPINSVVYGTADGVSFELVTHFLKNGLKDFNPLLTRSESSLVILRDVLHKMGFNYLDDSKLTSINSACATGNQAIGVAYQSIKAGKINRCIVGGVDSRCEPSNFLNFYLLGAVTTANVAPAKASRPFAKDRTGFVRGEGAAVLMLESRKAAEARGATILGRIMGYGCTSDAFRLTDGRDDGSCVVKAMENSIHSAGLTIDQIDYISAHGTSTPLNDRLETMAIKNLFGEKAYKIPVSSLKSQIGHSTIAASAIEAIACLIMLEHQKVAPTINYEIPDPECDLDYVPNKSRELSLNHIMSNAFGFGGQNACVVFGKAEV
jgi:3-oxoacyl-[acyl-carrier-protein] synthase II